jgi:hypothetical protein
MSNLPALYTLADEYLQDVAKLQDLDLDPQTVSDTLEGMGGALEAKATNVAMFCRNLESLADQIKQAEAAMATRRKDIEGRADAVRAYLLSNMLRTGITKIESPYFKIAIAKNPPSVVVDDEDTLKFAHPEFVKVVTTESIDKAAVKESLKAGQIVEGARLVQADRVTIK